MLCAYMNDSMVTRVGRSARKSRELVAVLGKMLFLRCNISYCREISFQEKREGRLKSRT